jgi:Zn-dependent peptidase ImmA (M78 family)/transcriptional regulator with XRE-family HTH domain
MAQAEQINPRIPAWARETAGLTVEEAAEKLGLKDSARATAVQKLQALEDGKPGLSRTMLERAASAYRRPLVAFYMSDPPARGERGEDFRATKSASDRDNATLDALLRDVRARQQMVREVLDETEEAQLRPFVGSARIEDGPKTVAAAIRIALGVSEEQQRRSRNTAALFSTLRSAAERIGIYVLLLGDVGSHHSDIGEDVFRGFALADDVAPFVVINDNDATAARSFTLMHELVHIWIGESGVSGPLRDIPSNVIERFCNDTASEFLLPSDAIPDYSELLLAPLNEVTGAIQGLGSAWKVSEPAVAYRFVQKGWIKSTVASQLFAIYVDRWRQQKQRERETRQPDDKGPDYYTMGRFRLGARLLGVVRCALQDDTLTHTRAAKILGVGPASVSQLLQEERLAGR